MSLDVHQSKQKIILAARTRIFPAPQREFLSNYEDDGNGNGKKQMHDYDVKMPTFTIYGNLVPRVRSVGRVGENPGDEVGFMVDLNAIQGFSFFF